jgi:hypothetical protein
MRLLIEFAIMAMLMPLVINAAPVAGAGRVDLEKVSIDQSPTG